MAAQEKKPDQIALARQLNNVPWCDEYERMISGMLYDPASPPLEASRFHARKLCSEYSDKLPDGVSNLRELAAHRLRLLRNIVGRVADDDSYIEPPFAVDYGCNIVLGKRFYANFNLIILDCALVTIGDRVMMGPNVGIYAATHETEVQSRRDNIEYARPVRIGNDCWIGGNVVILPGVTIGDGCTIASGAIVTKDIPPFSVAMGQPAKVVKSVAHVLPIA